MRIASVTPLLMSLALFACDADLDFDFDLGESTRGQRTEIEYSWVGSTECLFGCNLERSLVTGAEGRIKLEVPSSFGRTAIDSVAVASGDAVIEMVAYETAISGAYVTRRLDLLGVSQGFANLDLFEEDGTLIDTIAIVVADVAEVALDRELAEVSLEVGEGSALLVEVFDEEGRGMVGYPPLSWTILTGGDLVNLRPSPNNEEPITTNFVSLEALAKGTFSARVEAPNGAFDEFEIVIE